MECGDYPRVALRTARDKDAPDEFMHLVLADFLGLSLSDVAQRNIDKLAHRQRRAVLGGSGDSREKRTDLPLSAQSCRCVCDVGSLCALPSTWRKSGWGLKLLLVMKN